MPQLGQHLAWVTVDGIESPEYSVEHSADGTQVTCWIASEAGKNFAISWKASYPHLAYLPCSQQGTLYVDGARCATRIMRQHTNHEIVPTIKGIDTSPTTQRPLLFSKMELTDDDAYLHSATTELGDIKLEMTEVKVFDSRLADSGNETPDLQQKIHERSKKGSTHCVSLGKEICQPRFMTSSAENIRHLGTFIFKYRPLEILQANGIAPLNKKRKQAVISDDVLDLTQDDAIEETKTKKIKRLEAELAKLKAEQESNKQIKTEVKTEQRNVFQPGEIIDLT